MSSKFVEVTRPDGTTLTVIIYSEDPEALKDTSRILRHVINNDKAVLGPLVSEKYEVTSIKAPEAMTKEETQNILDEIKSR